MSSTTATATGPRREPTRDSRPRLTTIADDLHFRDPIEERSLIRRISAGMVSCLNSKILGRSGRWVPIRYHLTVERSQRLRRAKRFRVKMFHAMLFEIVISDDLVPFPRTANCGGV